MKVASKEELTRKVGDLKVLPFVARKVLDTISDDTSSIEELSEIIEKDQTITARILKISNSALYGLRYTVTSLRHAVLLLGFKTIKSLVLSVSTRSMYKKFGITEKIIWDHSVGAAIASKIISNGMGKEVEEITFIGGLMHDLGKVIMNNETPDVFSEVMQKTYNEGLTSTVVEKEIYGYTHAELGASVTEKWGFPPLIRQIIEYHHYDINDLKDIDDPLAIKGIACVNLADNICKILGIGYREADESIVPDELSSAVFLGLKKADIESLIEEIKESYEKEKSVFD